MAWGVHQYGHRHISLGIADLEQFDQHDMADVWNCQSVVGRNRLVRSDDLALSVWSRSLRLCDSYPVGVYHLHNIHGSGTVGVKQVLAIVPGGPKGKQFSANAPGRPLQFCDPISDHLFRGYPGHFDRTLYRVEFEKTVNGFVERESNKDQRTKRKVYLG